MTDIDTVMTTAPVIPVLTIAEPKDAVPLARALVEGGLKVLEITLRTPAGLPAIKAIATEVDGAIVGAGTILNARDIDAALEAGSAFGVSPGLTAALADAIQASSLPFLPGVATASEAMAARERGWTRLKFFPAEPSGGRAMLASIAGPLPDLAFCPTGGVSETTLRAWLDLKNVLCVGGSWLAPPVDVREGHWHRITERARRACDIAAGTVAV